MSKKENKKHITVLQKIEKLKKLFEKHNSGKKLTDQEIYLAGKSIYDFGSSVSIIKTS